MAAYQQWQLRSGKQWWETPSILPLRSWMKNLHQQLLGMGLGEKALMPALLVEQAWRQIVSADKKVQLLDPTGAARTAMQAWEVSCVWQCNNLEEHYLSLDQLTWQRWMRKYRSWLQNRQAIDESLLPDELLTVLERASDIQHAQLLPEKLILDGFLQLPKQLQCFVEGLRGYGVEIIFDDVCSNAVVHIGRYLDDEAELLGIAAQMRRELEHDSSQLLGLVVPDLQQRRDEVVRAFERVFYPGLSPLEVRQRAPVFEVSLGQALCDQPVIAMALSLLSMTGASIGSAQLSATMLSPYWLAADVEMRSREQFDRRLRDDRVSSLTLEQLQSRLYRKSRLNPAIDQLLRQRDLKPTTLSDWADRFSNWLGTLGWPTKAIGSEEYQAFSAWIECLDDMQLLDEGKAVGFGDAYKQIKLLATERVFQIETPATPVQVVGRLESHGLRFDCLWVAGFDSEQWPPEGNPTPFLHINEQKRCQVPNSSAELRLALAEKEYHLWASQAPLLVASQAEVRDGKALSEAMLPEIVSSPENQVTASQRLSRLESHTKPLDPIQTIAEALSLESIDDFSGPSLVEGNKVDGGARLFENQAICPFRAFALHRLKIRPLEEIGLGLDPRQQGNLLHVALELFWKKVKTHAALCEFDDQELGDQIEASVLESMKKNEVPQSLWALELERLTTLVHEWIVQCEKPRQSFEVLEIEQKQRIEHGGIQMDVIIDRVDKVGDSLVVIDYKTGVNNKVGSWADDRISNPQLPLYVLTDEEIKAASFAQVAQNQHGFIGIAQDDSMLPKVAIKLRGRKMPDDVEPITQWDNWRSHWRTSLDTIAQELRDGVATVTPMKSACNYCELKPFCRIDTVEESSEISASDNQDDVSATSPFV